MHATQEDPKDQGSPNNCFDHSSKSHMQDMPTHLDHMAMHSELGDEENPGKNGAVPLDTMEELKENLKSFTDSMHQKGSQVIMWMNSLEGLAHERATKPLGCINPCFSFSVYSFDSSYVFSIRFIEDAKGMLAGLEASFEKLAEVAHHIDMKQLTVEELLFFLACLYFKKRALTKV